LALAIVGRPNVGKSSLLNVLLGRDRAIVSPYPGTARDTVEASLDIDGLLLRIIDTAGIRRPADPVEQEGVRRAREVMAQAELLLVVLDGSVALTPDDFDLLAETAEAPRILVQNKSDLPLCWHPAVLDAAERPTPWVAVSAVQGQGVAELERLIVRQALGNEPLAQEEVLLTRARHRHSLAQALQNVQTATEGLRQAMPVEFVAFEVTEALRAIGEVLGEHWAGEVLERIFSSFCIGK
jgi:tRNA modification GTPase